MRKDVATIRFRMKPQPSPQDEWLGPESHVPNLRRDLRRSSQRKKGLSLGWIVGSMFAVGLAVGSLATLVLVRSRRAA
jgi:hypothetical protein